MKTINVVWADRRLLALHSQFSSYINSLRKNSGYDQCTGQTMIGRMLLKSLFPELSWQRLLQQIDYSLTGKPFLRNGSLQFSISHADDIVVLAYSKNVSLGVDLVKRDRRNNYAHLFLHPEETIYETSANASTAFLNQTWAKKEALSKLTGEGWGMGFSKINSLRPVNYSGKPVHFSEVSLAQDYYCVIATEEKGVLQEINCLTAEQLMNTDILVN